MTRFIFFKDFCKRYGFSKSKGYELGRSLCVYDKRTNKPLKPMRFDPIVLDKVFSTPDVTTDGNLNLAASKSDLRDREKPVPIRRDKICL